MIQRWFQVCIAGSCVAGLLAAAIADGNDGGATAVGQKAKDFELLSVESKSIKLSKLLAEGPVVLVVLRGYPGYQCPVCNKQVGELLKNADAFKMAKANVVLVYPGPSDGLERRAKEFIKDRMIPSHFVLVVDPGLELVTSYGLRWNAPNETAYPATLLIDKSGIVRFSAISKSHGGRTKAATVIDALREIQP